MTDSHLESTMESRVDVLTDVLGNYRRKAVSAKQKHKFESRR